MNIEDRVRDAYTLIDDLGPAVAPPMRRPVRRPAHRRTAWLAAPLTAAAAVAATVLATGALGTGPRSHTPSTPHSTSAGPGGMSMLAMVMRPSRDDQVEIYLCTKLSAERWCHKQDATQAQRSAIASALSERPEVLDSTYISEPQALAEAKKRFADSPGFVDTLQLGDIPDSYRVTVRRPADTRKIVKAFRGRPGVELTLVRQRR
ncbi:permease-like cell division protein FtsX [Actinomadura sp. DC4]|uniref:permease-like cell division protein FtsX n=1 Tax=Actinomadura sp. DC4 TaxID=3055069 RepID=UPI0025B08677|nr:permease-like cell division protein FtsX [Actinomadura sp. DC4]MDN3357323.1 permease-like cell division protein FtsX [Actinomadura sp. DC4]